MNAKFMFIIINITLISGFINILLPIQKLHNFKCQHNNILECNDRILYTKYLLVLRKTKRIFKNTTNINKMISILNNTNNIINQYNMQNVENITIYNNTDTKAKNIIMENIVLDVSNVNYIHVRTKKDKIIIELDKKKDNYDMFSLINTIDTYINILSILAKLFNIS